MYYTYSKISIHAPREGGDAARPEPLPVAVIISIHAPREGGDTTQVAWFSPTYPFQSTPPARGATDFCAG